MNAIRTGFLATVNSGPLDLRGLPNCHIRTMIINAPDVEPHVSGLSSLTEFMTPQAANQQRIRIPWDCSQCRLSTGLWTALKSRLPKKALFTN
jgi:hypothetical protein